MGSDQRPSIDVVLDAFGVAVTVTRPYPDETPVITTGVWHREQDDAAAYGTDFRRLEPRRVMTLPRDVLSTMPNGTRVLAPETKGAGAKTWQVEGIERVEVDCWRVFLAVVSS